MGFYGFNEVRMGSLRFIWVRCGSVSFFFFFFGVKWGSMRFVWVL